ncbi:hypothetical protein Droror1_Dr00025252 [Drosera rotundifolia]
MRIRKNKKLTTSEIVGSSSIPPETLEAHVSLLNRSPRGSLHLFSISAKSAANTIATVAPRKRGRPRKYREVPPPPPQRSSSLSSDKDDSWISNVSDKDEILFDEFEELDNIDDENDEEAETMDAMAMVVGGERGNRSRRGP